MRTRLKWDAASRYRPLLRSSGRRPTRPEYRLTELAYNGTLSWRFCLVVALVFHAVALVAIGKLAWQAPAGDTRPPPQLYAEVPIEFLSAKPAGLLEASEGEAGYGGGELVPPSLPALPALPPMEPMALPAATPPPLPEVIGVRVSYRLFEPTAWVRPAGSPGGLAGGEAVSSATNEVVAVAGGGQVANAGNAGLTRGMPSYLRNPPPVYPSEAKAQGWEGTTVLRVCVLPTGVSSEVVVAQSSGYPVLDEAAARAVKRWRFVPAREGAVAVMAWVEVPVVFSLARDDRASSGFSSASKHGAMTANNHP